MSYCGMVKSVLYTLLIARGCGTKLKQMFITCTSLSYSATKDFNSGGIQKDSFYN
jgi:hypothetical protein